VIYGINRFTVVGYYFTPGLIDRPDNPPNQVVVFRMSGMSVGLAMVDIVTDYGPARMSVAGISLVQGVGPGTYCLGPKSFQVKGGWHFGQHYSYQVFFQG